MNPTQFLACLLAVVLPWQLLATAASSQSIEAIGQPMFDIAMTNQFSLVLRLPKEVFSRGEAIPFTLVFRNTGASDINMEGIVPLYRSLPPGPPGIAVLREGKRIAQSDYDGLVTNVLCQQKITVNSKAEIVIMQGDLITLKGLVPVRGVDWKGAILGGEMKPGKYVLTAGWKTVPRKYSAWIRDVKFEIKK
jgi:hypothetical protein